MSCSGLNFRASNPFFCGGGHHGWLSHSWIPPSANRFKFRNHLSSPLVLMPPFCPQRRRRMTWSGKPGWWSSGWGWRRRGTPCWCLRRAAGSPGRLPTGETPLLWWPGAGQASDLLRLSQKMLSTTSCPRKGRPAPELPSFLSLPAATTVLAQEARDQLSLARNQIPRSSVPWNEHLGHSFLISRNSYCCSVAQSCPTLCDPMDCSTPGFPVLHPLLELAQTHVHWVSDAIQSQPLSSPSPPPSIFPSSRVFSNESVLHIRWPKYWCFSLSISPSNEYSGLISFRIDWLDLLVVQGTLRSLLQHRSSKASILWRSAFFMVQLSYPYMITRTIIALIRWTFVNKVVSLLFNTLSRFV